MKRANSHHRPLRRTALLAGALIAIVSAGVATASGLQVLRHQGRAVAPPRPPDWQPIGDLTVFDRAQTAADRKALTDPTSANLVAALTAGDPNVPESFLPGQPADETVRVALSHLGTADRQIVMLKTSRGRVCAALSGITGGCYDGLPASTPIDIFVGDPDVASSGEPPIIWGIVRNNVRGILIYVSGKAFNATVGGNAYFFQLPDSALTANDITKVTARLTNGTIVDVPATIHVPAASR